MNTAAEAAGKEIRRPTRFEILNTYSSEELLSLAGAKLNKERSDSGHDEAEATRQARTPSPSGTGGTLVGSTGLLTLLTHLFTYHPARSDQSPKYDAVNKACIRFIEDMLAILPVGPGRQAFVHNMQHVRMHLNQQIALDGFSVPDTI